MKYELLNKPFKIGNVELRNRFVMLPMTIEKTDNYHVGDDLVDFYEQRAKGGAALIELGSCYVCDVFDTHPKYHTTTGAVGVWDDCFIPGLTRTAEVCHKHGAKLAAQLQLCYEWRATGEDELHSYAPVSYTHLDVYKRQSWAFPMAASPRLSLHSRVPSV